MVLGATVDFVVEFVVGAMWPPHLGGGVADTCLMGPVGRPSE